MMEMMVTVATAVGGGHNGGAAVVMMVRLMGWCRGGVGGGWGETSKVGGSKVVWQRGDGYVVVMAWSTRCGGGSWSENGRDLAGRKRRHRKTL
ncbi:hypothetical protein Tco_1038459 [Tanacetum coccineum]